MATPALVVDKETVFDASLDGLLGCLHHLCRRDRQTDGGLRNLFIYLLSSPVVKLSSY